MASDIPCSDLSEKERAILRLLSEGYTQAKIAEEVHYSISHIEKLLGTTDSRSIYCKIGVKNQREAVTWYTANCKEGETLTRANVSMPLATDVSQNSDMTPPPTQVAVADGLQTVPANANETAELPLPRTYLSVLAVLSLSLIFLIFVPTRLRGGQDAIDMVLINLYALIPATTGIYALGHFHTRSRFMRTFRLFSIGLICWAMGNVIWAIYDVVIGPDIHYGSLVELGYLSQTVLQLISFSIWWREVYRRAPHNPFIWIPIALALMLPYLTILTLLKYLTIGVQMEPANLLLDVANSLGDSISLALAICLILPASYKLYKPRMKTAMATMMAGMTVFFLTGSAYMMAASLPDGHPYQYPTGGWIDLAFAVTFLIWGIGIGVASSVNRAFLSEEG